MQQTCNAQVAVSSIERWGRSSPQVCGKEDALLELPLVIRDRQGNFTADPQCVAELYAQEWKCEWENEDAIGFGKEIDSIRALREKHVSEAHAWASSFGLRAVDIRKACLSLPSKTAIGLDQHAFTDIANLPDNALDSLGDIIRQSFVKLAIPTQSLLQPLVLLGKKNGGSRTIAILHTTYRLTMRLVSEHISQRDIKFAGSGTLRSRAIQHSEHMSRGRRASSWPTMKVNM